MKYIDDFNVVENVAISYDFALIRLQLPEGKKLPEIKPGQFVQIKVDNSAATFLRRPISICDVDHENSIITLLVRRAGEGTAHIMSCKEGDTINMIYPLGKGFTIGSNTLGKPLLVGGGVGIAPMVYLGKSLRKNGIQPTFLTGAKTESALLLLDELEAIGDLHMTTDDGSRGQKGFVVDHDIVSEKSINDFDMIYCCGPSPMMKSVATLARRNNIPCEVSLENMMACGVGACLCCVEKTVKGNICVCTEGPVFDINELTW